MDRKVTMDIESMTEKHLDGIEELEKKSFAVPWSRAMFIQELNNPLATYFVLLMNGRVAGYAGMWVVLDEGHITNIAVDPDCRRLGAGRRLLEHLLSAGGKIGADSFTLEVRRSNKPALALYLSCGFEAAGIRKKYYSDNGEDAVIMWRKDG